MNMQEARRVALERVRVDHPDAQNPHVDSTQLISPNWVVKGNWLSTTPNAIGSMNFEIWIDEYTRQIVKAEYGIGTLMGSP